MKKLFTILFVLIANVLFAQKNVYSDLNIHGKTFAKDSLVIEKGIRFPDGTVSITAKADSAKHAESADSLGGKPPSFYVDTLSNQSISGLKTFNNEITINSTQSRPLIINSSNATQNGINIDNSDLANDTWQFIQDKESGGIGNFRINHQNVAGNFFDAIKIIHSGTDAGTFEIQEGNFKINSLTASQIVESDGSKILISAAKNTAYNKNFGTVSGTTMQGNQAAGGDVSGTLNNLTIVSASTITSGKIELATQTEVNTGTDAVRSIVPSTLTAWPGSTNIITLGTVASGTWSGTTVAVNKGGTGQASYINGQLLIGNTTGNTLTKSTLTGTSNQVNVVNSTGSITLSTPQNIHTTATPTFSSLILGTNSAATGTIRLPNASPIKWRNAANNGDVNAFTVNGSNDIVLGAASGGWNAVRIANDATLKLGFFAVTAVTRAGATDDIKDALTSYGLLQGTSATALNLDGGNLTGASIIGTQSGGGSVASIRSLTTGGGIEIRQTNASLDNKSWDILTGSEQLNFRLVNDANSAATSWMLVDRTGITVDQITFGGHIEAHATIQSGRATINGGGTWQTVTFPVAFPTGSAPRIVANDASSSNNRFTVSIRNQSNTSFQFLPTNTNASHSVHTGGDPVDWIAIIDN